MAWQANQRHAWVRGNNVYICRGKWRRLVARPGAEMVGRPAMQDVASFVPIRRGGQDMGATATDVRAARKRRRHGISNCLLMDADGLPLGRCATSSRHHPGSGLVSSGAIVELGRTCASMPEKHSPACSNTNRFTQAAPRSSFFVVVLVTVVYMLLSSRAGRTSKLQTQPCYELVWLPGPGAVRV